jgi:probable HAF family extracellular repeat protein
LNRYSRSNEEKNMKPRTSTWMTVVYRFLALAIPAQARVVYTPVNVNLPTNGSYPIDLNHDGITDFTFQISHAFYFCGPTVFAYRNTLNVQPTPAGGIVGGNWASALQNGVQIDSHQSFYGGDDLMYDVEQNIGGHCRPAHSYGYWVFVQQRYLGLEFQINGQTHYGWAELSTNNGNFLYGFAYETIPGMAIKTGQTMDPPDELGIEPGPAESEDSGPTASVLPPLSAAPKLQSSGDTSAAIPVGMAVQDQQQQKQQPRYTVTDLGTLGGTFSLAGSVNNRGWVDGYSTLAGDQSQHGFLWRNGVMIDLGTLGGPNSIALFPLNERGEVGGAAETLTLDPLGEDFCGYGDNLECLPYLWQEGLMTPLPTLGGSNGDSKVINNRGQVVGYTENNTQDPTCPPPQVLDFEAVIWETKGSKVKITELFPLPGDAIGVAFAINDNGQVVGITGLCSFGVVHAVLWQNGAVTDLGNLGGTTNNWAEAINNQGQAVGWSNLPGDMTYHTFLWAEDEGMQDLGTLPGDFASSGAGINSKGQVVGTSYDASGNPRAFLWQRGVMTDLNTLIPAGSPLFLLDGNGINSRGEIVGDALQVSTGEVHAYLATPCSGDRDDKEGCEDGPEGSTATGSATSERPMITLPESVRNLLRQQLARRYHLPGQPAEPSN